MPSYVLYAAGWTVGGSGADRVLRGEYAENFFRKTFAPSEIVAIATALLEDERQAARERQGTRTDIHPGNLPEGSPGEALEHVAKAVGVSRPRLSQRLMR